MKLELKHLDFVNNGKVRLIRLPHWDFNNVNLQDCELSFNAVSKEPFLRYENVTFGLDQIKVYKRQLSDLTKEIEVNGEKFVPIVELAKLFHTVKSAVTHFSNIVNAGFYGASVNCHIENDDSRFTYYQLRNDEFVLSNTYQEVQKLLEWHFDVFGLIEQGLAIDINTLEK